MFRTSGSGNKSSAIDGPLLMSFVSTANDDDDDAAAAAATATASARRDVPSSNALPCSNICARPRQRSRSMVASRIICHAYLAATFAQENLILLGGGLGVVGGVCSGVHDCRCFLWTDAEG